MLKLITWNLLSCIILIEPKIIGNCLKNKKKIKTGTVEACSAQW